MKEITFSEIVKNEICHLEYNEQSSKFLLLSFFINNSEFIISDEKYYLISTHFLPNIRLIKKLLANIKLDINCEATQSNLKTASNKTKWALKINDFTQIDNFFNNFIYDINKMDEIEKRAFFAGAFLSGGSVSFSLDKSNYHFEIRSRNYSYLNDLKTILDFFSISANVIKYRNQFKLYFKKSELISDSLKLLGAIDSLYKYEDFRIQRDFSNSLQRINNLDVSNINKTIVAATNQVKWIQVLKNKNAYDKLDDKAKIFSEIRMQNREASLEVISSIIYDKYNLNISRTSLNHIVRRIKELYLKISTDD